MSGMSWRSGFCGSICDGTYYINQILKMFTRELPQYEHSSFPLPRRPTLCTRSLPCPLPERRAWASTAASAGPGKAPESELQRGTKTILTKPDLRFRDQCLWVKYGPSRRHILQICILEPCEISNPFWFRVYFRGFRDGNEAAQ